MRHSWSSVVATLAFVSLFSQPLTAHRPGEGYIFVHRNEASLTGRVELPVDGLSEVLPLDTDDDGDVTDAEVAAQFTAIESYALDRVAIGTTGVDFDLSFDLPRIEEHVIGRFVVFPFTASGFATIPNLLEAEYEAIFDVVSDHRGFLVVERNVITGIEDNEAIPSLIFSPGDPRQTTDLTTIPTQDGFIAFVKHGVWHIWIGFDHILFILALVMAAVLRRVDGEWRPVASFTPALVNVATVITLFTIAHSVTLSLAALGLVRLSPRLVESVIALSVVAAAVNNVRPIFGSWKWGIVFGFGLFHGFGFATVLGHLTLNQAALAITLLGFNVGVELGQLAIIAAAFPLLYLMRMSAAYGRWLVPVGSAAIALLATAWFVQRAFEIG